ncbi:ABC transporter substrate-binding protein [Fusobacterium sp.]|uniref:ABC transporter substrate-binding protein n=1 Tax=Fusobacterium sp. TaxID=68766 RepID=UPI00396CF388
MKKRSICSTVVKGFGMLVLGLGILISQKAQGAEKKFKIGISQFAEHPALDQVRKGFEDELKAEGVDAEFIYKNAQGDTGVAGLIAQKFVSDKVDLIFGIATISAQTAKQATDEIPVLFSAVTDPVYSQLVDSMNSVGGNVTGTTDATPMDKQLALFKDLNPEIKKIGIIYNTSESNSEIQVEQAIKEADKLGLEIVPVGVNNINDIPQAMNSLAKKSDAFYGITDNIVASSIGLIAKTVNSKKIVSIGAEEAHVRGGLLMTNGLSYYELGKQTGAMAKKILVDDVKPSQMPVETSKTTAKVVNEKTMKKIGIDRENKAFEGAEFIK